MPYARPKRRAKLQKQKASSLCKKKEKRNQPIFLRSRIYRRCVGRAFTQSMTAIAIRARIHVCCCSRAGEREEAKADFALSSPADAANDRCDKCNYLRSIKSTLAPSSESEVEGRRGIAGLSLSLSPLGPRRRDYARISSARLSVRIGGAGYMPSASSLSPDRPITAVSLDLSQPFIKSRGAIMRQCTRLIGLQRVLSMGV